MKKLLTILVLIMLIISFFQITNMYALYKEELAGDYASLLGVWKIKVNETEVTEPKGQVKKFEISDEQLSYIASNYVATNKIAPGSQAKFEIEIDPADTDVSIIYQLNMESIDIPNVQIQLLEVENYFQKDGEDDIVNTEVNQNENLYTAVIPIEKIIGGYKNLLRLKFKWVNIEDNNTTDSLLYNAHNATNQNITWTSSNEDVATVANGVITAVSAGTANITVATADGNHTETCAVTVTNLAEGATLETKSAKSVVVDKEQVTLKKGATQILIPKVYTEDATNKNITWTSNNTSVATVTNGVITAVSAGTATITATTVDGSYTDTCVVTVTEDEVNKELKVKDVTLDKTTVTLKVGQTEEVKPTIWADNMKLSIPIDINFKQYTGEGVGNGS